MSSNLLSSENSIPWISIVLGLILACIMPFFISNYSVFQASMVLSYAIALVGMNILIGYSGQISLGHGAFMAIGAYTSAILMDKLNIPYWMTIPIAAFICLVVGFLFGLPALRLEGHYLALATFALAVALPQLLKFKHLEFLTGGVQGIVIMKPDPPWESLFGLKLNSDRWLYFLTLAVTLVMFVIGWNLIRGRVGRALIAIRDQPIAAASMGINTPMYKRCERDVHWRGGCTQRYFGGLCGTRQFHRFPVNHITGWHGDWRCDLLDGCFVWRDIYSIHSKYR
jgi:branched-chain amino acid transport system permease protein